MLTKTGSNGAERRVAYFLKNIPRHDQSNTNFLKKRPPKLLGRHGSM